MASGKLKQFAIGFSSALVGLANYALYRPWNDIYVFSMFKKIDSAIPSVDLEKLCHSVPNYFGEVTGYAPQFLHTLGFSLMFMDENNPKSQLRTCAGLSLFNAGIEVGQYFGVLPGTYDTKDVLAVLADGALAYGIGRLTAKKDNLENKVETQSPLSSYSP